MAAISPSPFSSDPMALISPGMKMKIMRESNGQPVDVEFGFDKITVSMNGKSIGISREGLINSFYNDDYDAIDRAAVGAVRYLRVLDPRRQFAKRRKFRTKQRNMRFATRAAKA